MLNFPHISRSPDNEGGGYFYDSLSGTSFKKQSKYNIDFIITFMSFFIIVSCWLERVCSTDLRLDTSANGFNHVYTSPQEIY
jgi:hypothetical protein